MCHFEAVLIGLMLQMAAISVVDGRENEIENQDRKDQHRQGGPVIRTPNFPCRAESPERPAQRVKAAEEKNEQNARSEKDSVANMMEHVMTHLVAKNKKNFRLCHLREGRIPHHHALRRTNAGHIGVERVELG